MNKTFTIENEIYDENILKNAISDFEEVAKIFFQNNTLVIEWETEEEIDEVFGELMNYYIGLFNQ